MLLELWAVNSTASRLEKQTGTRRKLSPPPAPSQRITIADADKVFLSNREGAKIAPATLRKYRTLAKQLAAFGECRGYVMLDQFTSTDIDVFYSSWEWALALRASDLARCARFSDSA